MSEFQRLVAKTAPPCTEVDPEKFFPVSVSPEHTADLVDEAKRICAKCPIRWACLENAIAINDTYAILGGTTPAERHAMQHGALAA